jgi:hypothetical protein
VPIELPRAGPATLELLDLAGRRAFTRELGRLGAGEHVLDVGGEPALRAGIYLVRLTQGSRSVTAKAVLVR